MIKKQSLRELEEQLEISKRQNINYQGYQRFSKMNFRILLVLNLLIGIISFDQGFKSGYNSPYTPRYPYGPIGLSSFNIKKNNAFFGLFLTIIVSISTFIIGFLIGFDCADGEFLLIASMYGVFEHPSSKSV